MGTGLKRRCERDLWEKSVRSRRTGEGAEEGEENEAGAGKRILQCGVFGLQQDRRRQEVVIAGLRNAY